MMLMNEEVEANLRVLGVSIEDMGNRRLEQDMYNGCNWWRITHLFLDISIYYDPIDALGSVGEPYYEMYDGEDTLRYLETDTGDQFLEDITEMITEHIKSVNDTPEKWL